MKITSETYKAYAAPACVATITLISSLPRIVSNFYPGATSKGILISGLASSAMTFFFTAAPEFQHRRDLGLRLSITSIFTCTIGIPFLNKAYEKLMRKTQIVISGYLRFGAECAFGVLLFEAIGDIILFPENPPEKHRPPPTPPPPKAKPKPKPKPKPSPGYIHIFPPPKDPPPYSPPKPDPWAWTDEAIARADARIAEQQRNPPEPHYPLPPPKQTYRPPIGMQDYFDVDQKLSDSWVNVTSEKSSDHF